jgi:hypothetical protein
LTGPLSDSNTLPSSNLQTDNPEPSFVKEQHHNFYYHTLKPSSNVDLSSKVFFKPVEDIQMAMKPVILTGRISTRRYSKHPENAINMPNDQEKVGNNQDDNLKVTAELISEEFTQIRYPHYAPYFITHNVNLELLSEITTQDLISMTTKVFYVSKLILDHLQEKYIFQKVIIDSNSAQPLDLSR